MKITRKGYYTILGPDEEWLLNESGQLRQVTSRDECYERITEDGRSGTFIIRCPNREVEIEGEEDVSVIITAPPGGANAWSYPGIPYVTDQVPSAIMPTEPTGADYTNHEWIGTYDPATVAKPTWTDASNQYYVDPAHPSANDSNNSGRGSPTAPRLTIPLRSGVSWIIPAGTHIFMVGDGNTYTLSNYDNSRIGSGGTSSNITWLIGVGTTRPVLDMQRFFIGDSRHFIVDFVDFRGRNGDLRIKLGSNSTTSLGAQYNAWRNCRFYGDGQFKISGQAFRIAGYADTTTADTRFTLIYNCEMFDFGEWDYQGIIGNDYWGVGASDWSRWTWLIDTKIYHMQSDSYISAGYTMPDSNTDEAQRTHYVYIAGCEFYENYENAIDNKNGYHIIASSNYIHDFSNSFKPANDTAVIISNNTEGPRTDFHWVIFNRFKDCVNAVRDAANIGAGETLPERNYVIGNVMWDCGSALRVEAGHADRELYFIHNTIVDCAGVGGETIDWVSGTGNIVRVDNNLWSNCGTVDIGGDSSGWTDSFDYNLLHNTTAPTGWDQEIGGLTTSDPDFVNAAADNFDINGTSPAVDQVTLDPIFATFSDMYGISILEGFGGVARPQGSSYDIGAYEAN